MVYNDIYNDFDIIVNEYNDFFNDQLKCLVKNTVVDLSGSSSNIPALEMYKQAIVAVVSSKDRNFAAMWLRLTNEIVGVPWQILWNWLSYSTAMQGVLIPEAFAKWAQFYVAVYRYNRSIATWVVKNSKDIFSGIDGPEQLWLLDECLKLSSLNWPATVEFLKTIPVLNRSLSFYDITNWYQEGFYLAQKDIRVGEVYFRSGEIWSECSFRFFKDYISWGKKLYIKDTELSIAFFSAILSLVHKLGCRELIGLLPRWGSNIENIFYADPVVAREYVNKSVQILSDIKDDGLITWSNAVCQLAGISKKAAIAIVSASSKIFEELSIEEFGNWFDWVFKKYMGQEDRLLESVALQTRESTKKLLSFRKGINLDEIIKSLTFYTIALFNREINIKSFALLPGEVTGNGLIEATSDGKRVYLPAFISMYPTAEENLKVYKSMLIHEVAHILEGTYEITPDTLKQIAKKFSLSKNNKDISEYIDFFSTFESYFLIHNLFELIEDYRVEKSLIIKCPGLEKELMFWDPTEVPETDSNVLFNNAAKVVFTDTLISGETSSGVKPGIDYFIKTFEPFKELVTKGEASAADSLRLATQWYFYINNNSLDDKDVKNFYHLSKRGHMSPTLLVVAGAVERKCSEIGYRNNKYFGKTFISNLVGEIGKEPYVEYLIDLITSFVQEENESYHAFADYDEWDYNLGGYKPNWARVREFIQRPSSASFVRQTLSNYYGLTASIKRYFALLRPDRFNRFRRQEDGNQLDLNALVEAWVDRKRGVMVNDGFYSRIDKRVRDVAVIFLIDLSGSTDQILDSSKSILDIEKESVVIMAEALEVLGDKYAIYGFNSEGRNKVNFCVIKEFSESYCEIIKQRIGGLNSGGQTRLGAAVRHAIRKFNNVESSVRLLILLSDGRPYDIDYCTELENSDFNSWFQRDELLYAQEDSRMAIGEAKMKLITPFCITVDHKGREYLEKIMGSVGYIVIDNIELLPQKLPELYKKLTV